MKKPIFSCLLLLFSISTYSQQISFTDDVTIENSNDQDGLIRINWTLSSTTDVWDYISIHRKIEDQDFSLRANISYNSADYYVDDSLCGVEVVYALSLYQDGVVVDSVTKESVYEDDVAPSATLLYSLNYQNDSITLDWEETTDSTATGYSIYKFDDVFRKITDIDESGTTSFTLGEEIMPCNQQDSLLMITRDLCSSAGSTNLTEGYFQSLTLIEKLTDKKCDHSVTIDFSEYISAEGLNQRILNHEIWVSENGGDAVAIDTLPPGTTQFIHENISSGSEYEYTIRTFLEIDGDTVSSVSCSKPIQTEEVPLPGFFSIENVTVTQENHIEVLLRAESGINMEGYRIYRKEQGAGNYEVAGQVEPPSGEEWTFTDENADPDHTSYTYTAQAIDLCGDEALAGDHPSTTIHLTVESNNNTNLLRWNAYDGGWEVDQYKIYRYRPEEATPVEEFSTEGQTTYSDTPPELEEGQWNYRVEAFPSGKIKSSLSNKAKANQDTFLRMPNAFRPGGNNAYSFKPVINHLPPSGYQLLIFNRWGQQIFETTDPQEGWDGTVEGEKAPTGTYVYLLYYNNNSGEKQTQKGTVVLIR